MRLTKASLASLNTSVCSVSRRLDPEAESYTHIRGKLPVTLNSIHHQHWECVAWGKGKEEAK